MHVFMKDTNTKCKQKAVYTPPLIQVESIVTEYSIAAASATITPLNSSSDVRQEWETGTDVVGDQSW